MRFRVTITKDFDVPNKNYGPKVTTDDERIAIEVENFTDGSLDELMDEAKIRIEVIKEDE